MASAGNGYILVLDDEPAIRTLLSRYLRGSGYDVRTTRSSDEALTLLGPDLRAAILDVILVNSGGRSGLDVLAAIRKMDQGTTIPVMMFTGFGLAPEVLKAIEEHRADLMHKPVLPAMILAWLQRNVREAS